jgi:hypothetical protein
MLGKAVPSVVLPSSRSLSESSGSYVRIRILAHPGENGVVCRCGNSPTASSTTFGEANCGWWHWHIIGGGLSIGRVENENCLQLMSRRPNQSLKPTPESAAVLPSVRGGRGLPNV